MGEAKLREQHRKQHLKRKERKMEEATDKLKTNQAKKRVTNRASFMGERCQNHGCYGEFKIVKNYNEYKLTCPYCGKRVESTRILKQKIEGKK